MNHNDITINFNERRIDEIERIHRIEELFNKLFSQIEELKKENKLLKKNLEETKRNWEAEKNNRICDRDG
jgi:predicted RNase H-like nuclease (RuvC/YqgF family)